MSTFQERLDRVGTRLDEYNGELVSIRRGVTTVTDKTASPTLMVAEEVIPGVSQTRLEYQDFAIDTDQYDLGGGPVLPERMDVIIRANGDEFQAVSFDSDEPVFQFTTSTRNRLLVHTQRIKEGP